eukprot:PhF_6_TR44236/c0_g1_i1/m.68006
MKRSAPPTPPRPARNRRIVALKELKGSAPMPTTTSTSSLNHTNNNTPAKSRARTPTKARVRLEAPPVQSPVPVVVPTAQLHISVESSSGGSPAVPPILKEQPPPTKKAQRSQSPLARLAQVLAERDQQPPLPLPEQEQQQQQKLATVMTHGTPDHRVASSSPAPSPTTVTPSILKVNNKPSDEHQQIRPERPSPPSLSPMSSESPHIISNQKREDSPQQNVIIKDTHPSMSILSSPQVHVKPCVPSTPVPPLAPPPVLAYSRPLGLVTLPMISSPPAYDSELTSPDKHQYTSPIAGGVNDEDDAIESPNLSTIQRMLSPQPGPNNLFIEYRTTSGDVDTLCRQAKEILLECEEEQRSLLQGYAFEALQDLRDRTTEFRYALAVSGLRSALCDAVHEAVRETCPAQMIMSMPPTPMTIPTSSERRERVLVTDAACATSFIVSSPVKQTPPPPPPHSATNHHHPPRSTAINTSTCMTPQKTSSSSSLSSATAKNHQVTTFTRSVQYSPLKNNDGDEQQQSYE